MTDADLLERVDALYAAGQGLDREEGKEVFEALLEGLESGRLRAAHQTGSGWEANASVKRGILLGFRLGQVVEMGGADLQFSDKDTYPAQRLPVVERTIRVVPGGSSVRRGAYIGERVTIMPPAFVNVGAYVGEGTMVDSHALVGSCAQIGGVLEPVGQSPVIVEDDALVGGNTGLYEGVRVGARAVIGAGVVLTASTPVYDLVHERELRATADSPLIIPPGAVVVPGARPARGEWAAGRGLMLAAALIVKYRDEKTDARAALEEALR